MRNNYKFLKQSVKKRNGRISAVIIKILKIYTFEIFYYTIITI